MLSQLPLFRTLQGEYVAIADCRAFTVRKQQQQQEAAVSTASASSGFSAFSFGSAAAASAAADSADNSAVSASRPSSSSEEASVSPQAARVLRSIASLSCVGALLEASGVQASLGSSSLGLGRRLVDTSVGAGASGLSGGAAVASVAASSQAAGTARDCFLQDRPEFAGLYRDLGIAELTDLQLLQRYVLPKFLTLPEEGQLQLLERIRDGWGALRTLKELRKAMQELQWLPVHSPLLAVAAELRSRASSTAEAGTSAGEASNPFLTSLEVAGHGLALTERQKELAAFASAQRVAPQHTVHPQHLLLRCVKALLEKELQQEDSAVLLDILPKEGENGRSSKAHLLHSIFAAGGWAEDQTVRPVAAAVASAAAPASSSADSSVALPAEPFASSPSWLPFLLDLGMQTSLHEKAVLQLLELAAVRRQPSGQVPDKGWAVVAFCLLQAAWHGEALPAASTSSSTLGVPAAMLRSQLLSLQQTAGEESSGSSWTSRAAAALSAAATAGVSAAAGASADAADLETMLAKASQQAARPYMVSSAGARALADIHAVPVYRPDWEGRVYAPSVSELEGVTAGVQAGHGRQQGGSAASLSALTSAAAGADPAEDALRMVRYRDVCLPSDVHLCWTVLPQVPEALLPAPSSQLEDTAGGGAGASGGAALPVSGGGAAGSQAAAASSGSATAAPTAAPSSSGSGRSSALSCLVISSPPFKSSILQHINVITTARGAPLAPLQRALEASVHASCLPLSLQSWAFRDSPLRVFSSIFRYLSSGSSSGSGSTGAGPSGAESAAVTSSAAPGAGIGAGGAAGGGWRSLSAAEKAWLMSRCLVPSGSSLYPPSRVFLRMSESLSPLAEEVPRALGAFDALLKQLGVEEAPKQRHYLQFLRELGVACTAAAHSSAQMHSLQHQQLLQHIALNPNELAAVHKILLALARGDAGSAAQTLSSRAMEDLYLPDFRGLLLPAGLVVFNDLPWFAEELSSQLQAADRLAHAAAAEGMDKRLHAQPMLTLLHPAVSAEVQERLGLRKLSQCVEERLIVDATAATAGSAGASATAFSSSSSIETALDAGSIALQGRLRSLLSSPSERSLLLTALLGSEALAACFTASMANGTGLQDMLSGKIAVDVLLAEQLTTQWFLLPTSTPSPVSLSNSTSNSSGRGGSSAAPLQPPQAALWHLQEMEAEQGQPGRALQLLISKQSLQQLQGLDIAAVFVLAMEAMLQRMKVHVPKDRLLAAAAFVRSLLPASENIAGEIGTVQQSSHSAELSQKLLAIGKALRFPASSFLAPELEGASTAAGSAASSGGSSLAKAAAAATPGLPITAEDRAICRPGLLREFRQGELVAIVNPWQRDSAMAAAADLIEAGASAEVLAAADAAATALFYGSVLSSQQDDASGTSVLQVLCPSSSSVAAGSAAASPSPVVRVLSSDAYYFLPSADALAQVCVRLGTMHRLTDRQADDSAAAAGGAAAGAALLSVTETAPAPAGAAVAAVPASGVASGAAPTTADTAGASTAAANSAESAEIVSAVSRLLQRAGVSMSQAESSNLQQSLQLQWKVQQQEQELQALQSQLAATQRELDAEKAQLTCNICMSEKVTRVLVPCGHCLCAACLEKLVSTTGKCVFDRSPLRAAVPLYLN